LLRQNNGFLNNALPKAAQRERRLQSKYPFNVVMAHTSQMLINSISRGSEKGPAPWWGARERFHSSGESENLSARELNCRAICRKKGLEFQIFPVLFPSRGSKRKKVGG